LGVVRDLSQAFQSVADALRPSVVSISSVRRIQPRLERRGQAPENVPEEFRRFFGDEEAFERFFGFGVPDRGLEQRGEGSGVLVSSDGYVVTNNHVVLQADEVDVRLSDGREFRAKVVGTDPKTDLAVLKIEATELTAAAWGDSEKMRVGEWVLAVGSPFGLEQTVTAGIVSAKGRANVGLAEYEDFLQTDAAINPGNSGGPLVNMQGEVIGINTAIASRTGGNMGVGFAIPSNMARSVMQSIIEGGRVIRGYLGAMIQDLSEDLASSFGFTGREGVLIGDVVPNGPAAKSGLQAGDIVVRFNGKPATGANQLRNAVAATAPNSEVELELFRDGKSQTLRVRVGELTDEVAAAARPDAAATPQLGMTVRPLTPELAQQLGVEGTKGVVVTDVETGSVAANALIQPGDVIVSVAGNPINSVAEYREAMGKADLATGVRLQVERGGARRFVFLRSR
jgi:serine protease Do